MRPFAFGVSAMRAVAALLLVHLPSAAPLRAAVIGGGLGGLTCCNALRKIGVDAHVFERAEKLSPQAGTGLTLWPNGLSAIEAIDSAVLRSPPQSSRHAGLCAIHKGIS